MMARLWGRRFVHVKRVNLSDIGEGIQSVKLVEWYVKKGDHVEEFDPLAAVQSDKATVDISSRYTGTVSKLCVQVGKVVKVGPMRLLFSLRQVRNESLSSNPVELVVQVTSKLERTLDTMGIPRGRGIGERLAMFKEYVGIRQNICSFVATRNRIVHNGRNNANGFCEQAFMEDYSKISQHLEELSSCIQDDTFKRQYLLETKGAISIWSYAQRCLLGENNAKDSI